VRLVLAALLVLIAASTSARTLPQIRESGVLRICTAGSSASFYRANGEAFARFLDVRAVVTELPSFEAQFHNAEGITVRGDSDEPQRLADGSCDLYPNDLHIVSWRESKLRLVPYYAVRNVIVAHRDSRVGIRNVGDLERGRPSAAANGCHAASTRAYQ